MLLYALIHKLSPKNNNKTAGHVFTGFTLRKPVKKSNYQKSLYQNLPKSLYFGGSRFIQKVELLLIMVEWLVIEDEWSNYSSL